MATYVYEDFRVTFTPRADGDYDVRAVDAERRRDAGVFAPPLARGRAGARRARRRQRQSDPADSTRPARHPPTVAAGPAVDRRRHPRRRRRRAADDRRRAARRRARRRPARAATSARPTTRPSEPADGERARGAPDAVARRRARAAERAVGVPLPAAAVPGQPAAHAARAAARDRVAGRRRRRSTPRCASSASSPAPATSPRWTSRRSAAASSRRRRGRAAGRVELDWLEPATPRGLRQALRDGNYHVLHYVGHSDFTADGEGVLYLEERATAGRSRVDETLFANLLSDQDLLRLVVLNSCEGARTTLTDPYAGVATTLVQLGVPAVVAMQFEISDAPRSCSPRSCTPT